MSLYSSHTRCQPLSVNLSGFFFGTQKRTHVRPTHHTNPTQPTDPTNRPDQPTRPDPTNRPDPTQPDPTQPEHGENAPHRPTAQRTGAPTEPYPTPTHRPTHRNNYPTSGLSHPAAAAKNSQPQPKNIKNSNISDISPKKGCNPLSPTLLCTHVPQLLHRTPPSNRPYRARPVGYRRTLHHAIRTIQ